MNLPYKYLQILRADRAGAKRLRIFLRPTYIAAVIVVAICILLAGHAGLGKSRAAPDNSAQSNTIASLAAGHGPVHSSIVTTVFWVGESADGDNDYISNQASAWDENWETHYGGVDTPTARSGYAPRAFTPHENPFYFALPYADLTDQGTRKPTASACLPYTTNTNDKYSWCKNDWIAVSYHGKTVYAQWEDVGPNEDDDANYVFGTANPKNTFGEKAGLDVSPAVQDYLKLDGSNKTSWAFVPASAVPDGPWKAHVTTSLGYTID